MAIEKAKSASDVLKLVQDHAKSAEAVEISRAGQQVRCRAQGFGLLRDWIYRS